MSPQRRTCTRRVRALVMVATTAAVLAVTGCATDAPTPGVGAPEAAEQRALAEAQQVRDSRAVAGFEVSIPKLGVSSDLIELGLNPDRTMQVPPLSDVGKMGLYHQGPCPGDRKTRRGPCPGDDGPAVILGHVNGNGQPGVFARLDQLRRGDQIDVSTPRGPIRFRVYETAVVDKASFPTAKVYSDTSGPELRLITCGGGYDAANRNYLSNIIVFARADQP